MPVDQKNQQKTVCISVAACVLAQVVLYWTAIFAYPRNLMVSSLEQISWGNLGICLLTNAMALLLVPLACLLITKTKPRKAGFTGENWRLVLALALAFIVLMVMDRDWSASGIYYRLHILFIIALGEELMYRGFVYSQLKPISPWLALLVSGFFWGASHAIVPGVLAGRSIPEILTTMVVGGADVPVNAVGGIIAGIGFAALYEWSGTLLVPIMLHAILDFSGHSPADQWLGFAVVLAGAVFLGVKRIRVEHKPLVFWTTQEEQSNGS